MQVKCSHFHICSPPLSFEQSRVRPPPSLEGPSPPDKNLEYGPPPSEKSWVRPLGVDFKSTRNIKKLETCFLRAKGGAKCAQIKYTQMNYVSCLRENQLIKCQPNNRKFLGPIVLQTFEVVYSGAQPYCIRTGSIGPIIKVSHMTHYFETRKQNTGYSFKDTWSIYVYFIYGLESHGPSMYISSIVQSHMVHLCILYLLFRVTWSIYVYFIYGGAKGGACAMENSIIQPVKGQITSLSSSP